MRTSSSLNSPIFFLSTALKGGFIVYDWVAWIIQGIVVGITVSVLSKHLLRPALRLVAYGLLLVTGFILGNLVFPDNAFARVITLAIAFFFEGLILSIIQDALVIRKANKQREASIRRRARQI